MKVGDCVALGLEIGGGEGHARGGRGVHAERVVDEVVAEARLLDFLLAQSLGAKPDSLISFSLSPLVS